MNGWRYAGIEYDDVANGDGVGAVFFTQGCSHRCPGCQNPQTWAPEGGMEFTEDVMEELLEYYRRVPYASRLTLSGGDPLDNGGLTEYVIRRFKESFPGRSVWLYTGYTLKDAALFRISPILSKCEVVVDGEFDKALRDITLRFRGSSNQRLIDVRRTVSSGVISLCPSGRP